MKLVVPWLTLTISGTANAASIKDLYNGVNGAKLKEFKIDSLPDTGEPWTTLPNGVEFQPAKDLSPLAQLHLRRLTQGDSDGDSQSHGKHWTAINYPYSSIYTDTLETYYDEYAQAWRCLGFYIDCNYCPGDEDRREYDSYNNHNCWQMGINNAYQTDDDEDGDGDHDQRDRDGGPRYGCQRFLLWAAYIDEGYSGNRAGEYMYYDRKSNKWSDKACKQEQNKASSRCVKMDCHLPDTHFKLLGFFKEPEYDEWMEQLFKHEGDCVWTDEEYQFMQADRKAWPNGCTKTIYKDSTNTSNYIYYDLKPEEYGGMSIGLYTDTMCVRPYKGSMTVEQVLKGMVCGGYVQYDDDDDAYNDDSVYIDLWCNGESGKKAVCSGQTYVDAETFFEYCGNTTYFQQNYCYQNKGDLEGYKYQVLCGNNTYYQKYLAQDNDDEDEQKNRRDRYRLMMASGSVWSVERDIKLWNDAFDVFKQCQPCKAYMLNNIVAGIGYSRNAHGDRYNSSYFYDNYARAHNSYYAGKHHRRQLNNNNKNNQNNYDDDTYNNYQFHCFDDADYNNVNQCMKFATHTKMLTAEWRDVEMAVLQGTITRVTVHHNTSVDWSWSDKSVLTRQIKVQFNGGQGLNEQRHDRRMRAVAYSFLIFALLVFCATLVRLLRICREAREGEELAKELLARKSHRFSSRGEIDYSKGVRV